MHSSIFPFRKWLPTCIVLAAVALVTLAPSRTVHATEAHLLIEADTGKVLEAENATFPWYPASVTKLMTAYVTLTAVKQKRLTLDTLLTVSPTAAAQSPSKMGFRPGTQVTVDNALKMMMVKSANDMAVVLAEGVGGSIDGFSAEMNAAAQRLGMTQSSYVNPNGLPADGQISSARDMAILARAFIHDLPEYEYFVHIPSIRYGRRVTHNFNKLIGRFPGADGFKTGFICASGYNLVASATQNGKRLIAVVLGASSGTMRAVRAAQMLERGFANNSLSWLRPALGTVDRLAPIAATPPNLRDEMCGPKRRHPASDEDNDVVANTSATSAAVMSFFATGAQPPTLRPVDMIAAAPAPSDPVIVYTGPTRTGAAIAAAAEADAARDAPPKSKKPGKTARDKPAPKAEAREKSKNRVSITIDPKSASKSTPKSTKPPVNTKPAASPSAKPKTAEGKSKP
ncbi:peptidase S11, D-alanyl-D-alanine carboxypeptidase 1 [Nitrobacter winogradskyi Nb-255]|uniref:Peptidase S11, D-alanyl-D-alanine carboxypeptidase 1 n=1 Tax=Nitrobacter winogradskyi (strain ATCC 25391 / DSM 10237 / CIP 104748 / NCIMB 11846 / Nb-255) TaxID=323098 RepID=Q3SP56_NITWN|nr:peptidase S11, D-alanyl-D-alanine carboxypeptidase 1 [Nitrobacter winogradskyi Nb-255]